MHEFNSDIVIPTLKKVISILEKNHIEYRFLGSLVIAGINGKLHRKLGDLDLIIDVKGKDTLYKELTDLGYTRRGGMFAFARKYLCLETLTHPHFSEIGYFYGTWLPDGSFMIGNTNVYVAIEAYALKATKYFLPQIAFIGIPEKTAATGIKISQINPKRKKERELFSEKSIKPFPNTYVHVAILGLKMDWIYHFTMMLLNIIGLVRVKLGLAFDPWR